MNTVTTSPRKVAPRPLYLPRHNRSIRPAVISLPVQPEIGRLWDPRLLENLRTPISRVRE